MNNLIGTHALILFLNGDCDLSDNTKKAKEDKDAINFISKASLWEIALKIGLDKLEPKTPFSEVGNISAITVFRFCSSKLPVLS
ncbi:MAG: PIN domain nuclease [Ferruginibacter sp.]|nr:PIN domain nuclease [Ferruginibacter sp.]